MPPGSPMTDHPKRLVSAIFAVLVASPLVLDLVLAARARSGDRPWLAGFRSAQWIAGAAWFTLAVHFPLGHACMLELVCITLEGECKESLEFGRNGLPLRWLVPPAHGRQRDLRRRTGDVARDQRACIGVASGPIAGE